MKKMKKILTIMVLTIMMMAPFARIALADPEPEKIDLKAYEGYEQDDPVIEFLGSEVTGTKFSPVILNIEYSRTYLSHLSSILQSQYFFDIQGHESDLVRVHRRNPNDEDQIVLNDPIDVLGIINVRNSRSAISEETINQFVYTPLMNKHSVTKDKIDFKVEVSYPKKVIEDFADSRDITGFDGTIEGLVDNKIVVTNETPTSKFEAIVQKVIEKEIAAGVIEESQKTKASGAFFSYGSLQASVDLGDTKAIYQLVLGNDKNWYLYHIGDDRFKTELTYSAKNTDGTASEGKVVDGVYKPFYYENEVDKVDATATATITAKNGEAIVSVKGDEVVAMKTDGTANSLGWYYPNTDNKAVIAKDYPLATYDNIKKFGKIKETVILIGKSGREDTQEPNIEWTFRIKKVDTTTNSDDSTTVVITYNLPVNVKSIPDGWSALYDSDGITCHKITKTIAAKEGYDKDVTVEQLRDDDKTVTATTHIKVAPKSHATTGESMAIVGVIVGIVVFAWFIRRKIRN